MIGGFEKFWCGIIIFGLGLAFASCNTAQLDQLPSPHSKEISLTGTNGPVRFFIEIADTPAKRARGLMERTSMPENHGMLFVFEKSDHHIFWMKNTPLSLDIIFFDNDFRVVGIIENAEPFSRKSLAIEHEARFALEVLAGSAKKHGINLHSVAQLSYD